MSSSNCNGNFLCIGSMMRTTEYVFNPIIHFLRLFDNHMLRGPDHNEIYFMNKISPVNCEDDQDLKND